MLFLCPCCVSLLVHVVRLVFLITAHVRQICTTVQYCRYKKKRRPPRTTVEIPFNMQDILFTSSQPASEQNRKAAAKMAASVIVSFDVMRAGCASATAASSIHQPSADCSVLGHPPRSRIGPRVCRILVVLQITLQTTPRATAALLPPGKNISTQKKIIMIIRSNYSIHGNSAENALTF